MDYGSYDALHYVIMTAMVQDWAGEPGNLGATIFAPLPIPGLTAKWDVTSPTKGLAPMIAHGAGATAVPMLAIEAKYAGAMRALLTKNLDADTLLDLRAPGSDRQQAGQEKIASEMADLFRVIEFTREYYRWQALTGTITLAHAGVIVTINYGLSAAPDHTPDASASWNVAGTDIIGDLNDWRTLIEQGSGYTPTDCYCGRVVSQYIMKNTGAIALLSDSFKKAMSRDGEVPYWQGFNWHFYDKGYLDATGTFVPFIATDKLIMLSKDAPGFNELMAPSIIPTGYDTITKATSPFSYSKVEANPPGVDIFVGANFIPIYKVPDAVVYAELTP